MIAQYWTHRDEIDIDALIKYSVRWQISKFPQIVYLLKVRIMSTEHSSSLDKCRHCLLHVSLCVLRIKSLIYFPAPSYLIDRISEIILMATKVIKSFSVCLPFSTFCIPLASKLMCPFFSSQLRPYSNPNESNLNATQCIALQLKPA